MLVLAPENVIVVEVITFSLAMIYQSNKNIQAILFSNSTFYVKSKKNWWSKTYRFNLDKSWVFSQCLGKIILTAKIEQGSKDEAKLIMDINHLNKGSLHVRKVQFFFNIVQTGGGVIPMFKTYVVNFV